MKALIAQKIGMTQLFDEEGNAVPVTVLKAGPCTVIQVKTKERDGYNAVQLGFGAAKRLPRPQEGHAQKAKAAPSLLREIRLPDVDPAAPKAATEATETVEELAFKPGSKLDAGQFAVGERVQVTGISKGKGFAGTIKRHNFHRGPKTHGSHNYRAPGSIGAMYPQKVFKGIKMAGQMGHAQVSVRNLQVAAVDVGQNRLALRGAVPGPRQGIVIIKEAV